MGEAWRRFAPDQPFVTSFLSQEIAAAYRGDERLLAGVKGFAALAVVLSCLGVYGLAAHSAASQRRQIGIRRAIGASVSEITGMLVWSFLKWVALAIALAAPVALWASRRWLQGFAYRTELPLWLLLAAALLVAGLALVAVGFQAMKAANSNPAESLKEGTL
jgi:putative ABC transport system permease protein